MLITTHLITGAAIGSLVSSLPLSIILAILSHYSLDLLPHFDQGVFKDNRKKFYFWATVDFIVGGTALYLIFSKISFQVDILVVSIAAIAPDLMDSSPIISSYIHKIKLLNRIYKFHKAIQKPGKKFIYSLGILTQLIVSGISLYLLLN